MCVCVCVCVFLFTFLVKQNQVWWCPVKLDDQKGYIQYILQALCLAILYESGFSDRNKRIKEGKKIKEQKFKSELVLFIIKK